MLTGLSQPSRSWHKIWIAAVSLWLFYLPLNEFCHSTGTENFAEVKGNLSVTTFFLTGIDLGWHDELDTSPAACRIHLQPGTDLVVTSMKVLISLNQEVDHEVILSNSTNIVIVIVHPLMTSRLSLWQSNITVLDRKIITDIICTIHQTRLSIMRKLFKRWACNECLAQLLVYCCAFCAESPFSFFRT